MKKILMTLVAAGLILTGCTRNETEGYDIANPDVISFSSSTSRAVIHDLSTLTNDVNGFRVYGKTANVSDAWHTNVNGENNYAYSESNWGWVGTPAEWPTTDASYPMSFYAMYPADQPTTVTAATVLSRDVTIAATAATQTDLLAATATAESKPASGKLSMTFDHILSKVNFGVIAGHDMVPEILTVKINNVNSYNTYNYILHTWGNMSTTVADYDYFHNTTVPFTTTGTDTNEEVAVPFYTSAEAASAHLMLMPQTAESGAPAAWDMEAGTLNTNSYIEVIYRITTTTLSDYIGYTEGGDYMVDYPLFNNPGWGGYSGGLGTGDSQYNDHLYIRVGFPVAVSWVPGKGYVYNLCLGTADSTNGYYIDTTYYDNTGSDTGVPIKGPEGEDITPGDPVTSGVINFLIDVSNWDDNTPPTPLQ